MYEHRPFAPLADDDVNNCTGHLDIFIVLLDKLWFQSV